MNIFQIFQDLGRRGIARRLVIYILLASSFVTLFATLGQLNIDYRSDVRILEDRLDQIEASFGQSVAEALWNVDYNQANVNIEGILRLPDIVYVAVIPQEDRTQRLEVGRKTSESIRTRSFPLVYQSDDRTYDVGELIVTASMQGIYQRLKQKVFYVLVTQAIKTFLVSIFMLFIFNILIIKNLKVLADFAGNMQFSNLREPLELNRKPPESPDEFDEVVVAFNQMQAELTRTYDDLMNSNRELDSKQKELAKHRDNLERLVQERTQALQEAQQSLLENAHRAGMAEIAVGILHNIGNTLNSLNISLQLVLEKLNATPVEKLERANELLSQHMHDLTSFLESQKGNQLAAYYLKICRRMARDHYTVCDEVVRMEQQIETVRNVIADQQSYARHGSYQENVDPRQLVEEVLGMEHSALKNNRIQVSTHFEDVPFLSLPRPKVTFVLMQLLRNAIEALADTEQPRLIELSVGLKNNRVAISVADNGPGVDPQNEALIFEYGFSTKPENHGFGLHTCANAMTELGGSLAFSQPQKGNGAVFTLIFKKASEIDHT